VGAVHVVYYTDPACPRSWAAEPALRRLEWEFAESLTITYVMGGLAREFSKPLETMRHVFEAAEASGMPVDARLWLDHPPASSYPACQGVKAAADQRLDGSYLRVVREGLMVERRKIDTVDALVDAARRTPGMDVARFEIDLLSHATAEAFAADLDRARTAAPDTHAGDPGRVPLPSFEFRGDDGEVHGVYDQPAVEPLLAAARAAGAQRQAERPGVEDALRHFGRMATAEIAAVCELPGPRAAAELWRLAAEWRVRDERVLTGELWHLA
jgi:predicted DsbA family dithiol-disulfide isomerase